MKKKIVYYVLIGFSIIIMVASTILSVCNITKLKNSPSFDKYLLILSIGFIALTVVSLITSFILFVKVLKGDTNGKNS